MSQGESLELVRDGTLCNRMETSLSPLHARKMEASRASRGKTGKKVQSAAAGRSIGELELEENTDT